MASHRERLISLGIYKPFNLDKECERNGILKRMAEGETFSVKPEWCVFRKDDWKKHIGYDGEFAEHCCQSAELIADKLTSYEAHRLCDKLNSEDPEQPKGGAPCYLPLGMYGIATMKEWNKWAQEHSQMSIW